MTVWTSVLWKMNIHMAKKMAGNGCNIAIYQYLSFPIRLGIWGFTCSFAHSSTGLEDHWWGCFFSGALLVSTGMWLAAVLELLGTWWGFRNWGGMIPASVGSGKLKNNYQNQFGCHIDMMVDVAEFWISCQQLRIKLGHSERAKKIWSNLILPLDLTFTK